MTAADGRVPSRILIAGLGNVFLSDDGFGVAVAEALATESWPEGVNVRDYGVRALHLAFDLEDYDAVVMIDAMSTGRPAGTLALVDPTHDATPSHHWDAHTVTPDGVLASAAAHGITIERVLLVGCEPECVEEGIGLSPTIAAAVPAAAAMCREAVARLRAAEWSA